MCGLRQLPQAHVTNSVILHCNTPRFISRKIRYLPTFCKVFYADRTARTGQTTCENNISYGKWYFRIKWLFHVGFCNTCSSALANQVPKMAHCFTKFCFSVVYEDVLEHIGNGNAQSYGCFTSGFLTPAKVLYQTRPIVL